MNASYVQPLGTTKRYIATQGPLPATFNDFWTLCWEQNVHVIVMLTREVEGATVKCGKYWAEGMYGPLRLRLLTTDDTPEREQRRRDAETSGGFFGAHVQSTMTPRGKHRKARDHHHRSQNDSRTQSDSDSDRTTIRRVFELTHTGYPDAPSRNVTQLQYLDWPDFNVPEDPRGLLGLMREVDDVAERARGAGDKQWGEGPSRSGPWRASADTRGTSTGGAGSDVEPTTGVACHASGNPPVLLHCSAGVGRTGGFIAVDAVLDSVRREMRKRKESQGAAASTSAIPDGGGGYSTSKPSDGEGSASRSSSREAEAMEVDPSPSPSEAISSGAARLENSTLTVPVSVGQNEVHVPVAGFTGPIAMDVDDAKYVAHSGRHGNVQPVRSSILPATPELVNEVRRVAFNRHSSISTSIPSTVAPETTMSSRSSESGSDSGAARSGSRSGSGGASASELHSRSLSSSPPSSLLGSSTSLSAVVSTKAAEIPLQENLGPQNSGVGDVPAVAVMDSRTRRLSLPAPMSSPSKRPKFAEDTANTAESTHASRLDTWRSEVRTSGSPPRDDRPPLTSVELPQFAQGLPRDDVPASQSGASHRGRTYDYPHPRRLHEDVSPPVLSIYDEPIRRVVEDMREQRMSLCQSLRQYVFVHRAVIEGALMIVDDEREKERAVQRAGGIRAESRRVTAASDRAVHGTKGKVTEEPEQSLSNSLFGSGLGHGLGTPIVLNEKDSPRLRRMSHGFSGGVPVDLTSSIAPMHSPGRSKRGASPTELLKEGTQGEVVLTKRPSVKRRQRYEDDTPVEFEPILLSSPSQVPPGSR
ncbi:hypothetical protein B0H21DRAFT_341228 [Amylocystis lapponica]|nr:hypothetical protein B0H21DRAFT_341228 [Amylocystis lapponica]